MTRLALTPMQDAATAYFKALQDRICAAIEALEPNGSFRSDGWSRDDGGGKNRVLEGGEFIEKGGVITSEVYGRLPEDLAAKLPGDGATFWASGVGLVLYPRNPFVPAVHAHVQMIQRGNAAWFGGGADMTPYYPFIEDVQHFHRTLKTACDAHDPAFHPDFKAQCDRAVYSPHRKEHRGVGGIVYDTLTPAQTGHDIDALFAFVQTAGDALIDAFLPIATRRMNRPYDARHRAWQAARRGRDAEFTLMHDRGTRFGLRTDGHIESTLMSLPPAVSWRYALVPSPDSPEARLAEFLKPRDWAGGATIDDAPTLDPRSLDPRSLDPVRSETAGPGPAPPQPARPWINVNPPPPRQPIGFDAPGPPGPPIRQNPPSPSLRNRRSPSIKPPSLKPPGEGPARLVAYSVVIDSDPDSE